eukprot:Colp12_sorted_trinity150504_noHs@444
MSLLDVSQSLKDHASKFKPIEVHKEVPLLFDLGNLAAFDGAPVDEKAYKADPDAYVRDLTRDNVQLLFNEIWKLPIEVKQDAVVATLPAPTTRLPREKPAPKPKAKTRWEKFAELKGIKKEKRSKMVYDEEAGEYKPRYGYKRANDETQSWLLPVPQNEDPYQDQFEKRFEQKKANVAKNEKQRLRNLQEAGKVAKTVAPMHIPEAEVPKEKKKEKVLKTLEVTKGATASMGKFDKVLADEPKTKGKKRKFEPLVADIKGEQSKQLSMLSKIVGGDAILNTTKAANTVIRKEQFERAVKKREAASQGKGSAKRKRTK